MRVDKYLWCVRLYKTRALAAEACKGDRILVNDAPTKAARELAVGDEISIKQMPITFRYRILELVGNRQPARNVTLCIEDITPQEELDKQEVVVLHNKMQRPRGAGRPTKRERRQIEDWLDQD